MDAVTYGQRPPTVVELFAGAGGAALGLEAAGFSHLACIENDADACATLRAVGLPCVEGDVRDPDLYESEWVGCDLLWASFPCQAWSSAGKREGAKDERNGWPWTVDAIDRLKPQWFAAENVTGLLTHRSGCRAMCLGRDECPQAYFDLVILTQLQERYPVVQYRVLNASSFGVPQHRRRVIILAGPRAIEWPKVTHGNPTGQCELFSQPPLPWATPDYWPTPSPTVSAVGECKGSGPGGNPQKMQRASDALYLATGRRRLTIEECALLQDFPADHPFQGVKSSRYRQVGNAVPPALAEAVGRQLYTATKTSSGHSPRVRQQDQVVTQLDSPTAPPQAPLSHHREQPSPRVALQPSS